MKETIYTIPVNDAFNKMSECPVCELLKDLEKSNIEYTMGAALMEPNVRIEMNKKGFCNDHYSALVGSEKNALGLSLILTSHHEALMKDVNMDVLKTFNSLGRTSKQKIRNKQAFDMADKLIKIIGSDAASCFICDRITYTMDKYLDVIIHMWKTDTNFRTKFLDSKGFCNKHTSLLLQYGKDKLKNDEFSDFSIDIATLFFANWKRNEEDLRWFAKKFDYRFKDEPWKNSKDALPRFSGKIAGFTD